MEGTPPCTYGGWRGYRSRAARHAKRAATSFSRHHLRAAGVVATAATAIARKWRRPVVAAAAYSASTTFARITVIIEIQRGTYRRYTVVRLRRRRGRDVRQCRIRGTCGNKNCRQGENRRGDNGPLQEDFLSIRLELNSHGRQESPASPHDVKRSRLTPPPAAISAKCSYDR